jgi:Cdc6-like AAA superfamily ATPase
MNEDQKRKLRMELREAFTPGAPIDKLSLFAGRPQQTDLVVSAILQKGRHAILYGERGVGKTSMAKVLAELISDAGLKTVNSDTINCDPTDDFSSLWHKAFKELTFKIKIATAGFGKGQQEQETDLDTLVPKRVAPDDVRRALSTLRERTVIVFDEFDRIQNREAKTLMADTIKNLSDHTIDTTLLIVGVAQSVMDLILEHRSIERSVIEIPMPRMSLVELEQIIAKGLSQTEMTITDPVKNKIVRLSHGLPHYTHLLALESGICATERGSAVVEDEDFTSAVMEIVKTKQTVSEEYHNAVSSSYKNSRHKTTLLACALSPIDAQGFFQASAAASTLGKFIEKDCQVSDIQKHLTEYITERRGKILQRQGTSRRFRYRFSNPLMQPYTIIHSISEKLITESQVWMLDQPYFTRR